MVHGLHHGVRPQHAQGSTQRTVRGGAIGVVVAQQMFTNGHRHTVTPGGGGKTAQMKTHTPQMAVRDRHVGVVVGQTPQCNAVRVQVTGQRHFVVARTFVDAANAT